MSWKRSIKDLGFCCALDKYFGGLFLIYIGRHQYDSCPQHAMVPIYTPSFGSPFLPEFGVHEQVYPMWKREVPLSSQSSPLKRVNKQLHIPPPLAFKAFQNPHSTDTLAGSPQTFLFFLLARTNDMKFLGWAQSHSGAQPCIRALSLRKVHPF